MEVQKSISKPKASETHFIEQKRIIQLLPHLLGIIIFPFLLYKSFQLELETTKHLVVSLTIVSILYTIHLISKIK